MNDATGSFKYYIDYNSLNKKFIITNEDTPIYTFNNYDCSSSQRNENIKLEKVWLITDHILTFKAENTKNEILYLK